MRLTWKDNLRSSRFVWGPILAGMFVLVLAACGSAAPDLPSPPASGRVGQVVPVDGGGAYTDILAEELNVMLEEKDFFFVNVHIPYEGEIPDTDAFIPFDQVAARIDEFPDNEEAKIVLYCRSGSMGAIAARELVKQGYTSIYNLDGGFRAWDSAGFEFIQP
ncbi:MAG: rhodanese-like domain-containing protein [Anaerolineales bacterium]|nr:rhodanese-like domain-containing protein [Anaerolineales bacterium]